ncbi:Dbl homology domain-containing protein [Coemansia spiralis]|nr:Dbl homology domain-containing protein [Coemansia spiralis]
MRSRRRPLVPFDNSSSTSRAVSMRRAAYMSPYDRAVHLIERMLRLPSIATYLYPILIDENSTPDVCKNPRNPLKTLFARGYTLNILLNELESPFVATINLYELMDESNYETCQTERFWKGCVDAGLATPEMMDRALSVSEESSDEYLDMAMAVVSAILDILQERGVLASPDPRYIKPRTIYPVVNYAPDGAPKHAVLAAELSRTEVAYMQDLERLMAFAANVKAHVDSGSIKVDTATIFGHISDILALHLKFSMRIQYMAAVPVESQYFDALFAGLSEGFVVYSRFCASREHAQKAYRQALPVLRQLDCTIDPVFDVPSLFMRPVQRLAQYPMLFQSIADAICENAHLSQATQAQVVKSAYSALRMSKRILRQANEATREALNETQYGEFFERLDIPLSSHTQMGLGRLLLSSKVSALVSSDYLVDGREAFLFENNLVLCKAGSPERESKTSRIKRTLSSLQIMRSPSLRPKRESGSSASSTLHSPPLLASSPEADGLGEKSALRSTESTEFQLPTIDTGYSLTAPPCNPALLSSHASLTSLREKPMIRFTTDVACEDGIKTKLTVCEQIPTCAISRISVGAEAHGFARLTVQAMMVDGGELVMAFGQMSSEAAGVWTRMFRRAVSLVPADACADGTCVLVNPKFSESQQARHLAA